MLSMQENIDKFMKNEMEHNYWTTVDYMYVSTSSNFFILNNVTRIKNFLSPDIIIKLFSLIKYHELGDPTVC